MEWLQVIFSSPLKILNGFLALWCLVISVNYFYELRFSKKSRPSKNLEKGVNSILLICFFMMFFISIDEFTNWAVILSSLAISGTGDPRVMASGLSQLEIVLVFNGLIISFFMIIWFVLRAYNSINRKDFQENNLSIKGE